MPFPIATDVDELLARMEVTPGRYAELLRDRDESELNVRPTPDSWSAREILAHVRGGDDLLTARVYIIMVRDNPPFVEIDERRLSEVAGYVDYPLDLLLDAYVLRRRELLLMLRRIDLKDWKRTGEHAKRGRMTVFTVAKHISDHEIEHLRPARRHAQGGSLIPGIARHPVSSASLSAWARVAPRPALDVASGTHSRWIVGYEGVIW